MPANNDEKTRQLGMAHGSANNILRKSILFSLVKRCGLDSCFQCGKLIEDIDEFSMDHKVPWLHSPNPAELFFDLDNLAFSHLSCNIRARRSKVGKHPSTTAYRNGCRCKDCKRINSEKGAAYRLRKKQKQ